MSPGPANHGVIRVYLVDDQAMVRAAFKSLLRADPRFEVLGGSGDARAAVDQVRELRPDVVLLDVSMPGLSGIDAIPMLREAWPRVRIVMLTNHEGDSFVERALQAGAHAYLSKDSDPAELRIALEAVARGDAFLSPRVSGGLLHGSAKSGFQSRISSLTPREREVFQLLAIGRSNKQVAQELEMTLGTAKKHRENLQRKLDCHSTAELALLAVQEGLIPSS